MKQKHPLDSAKLKVKRANAHIETLERSINRLLNPQVSVRKAGELKGLGDVVAVSIEAKLHENWPLMVGDILANLRASLDHIAWALAIKHASDGKRTLTSDEETSIVFRLRGRRLPSKDAFIGGLNWNDVRLFPPSAHAKIEEFQPYHRRNRPKNGMLGDLGDLANWDKHRIVTPALVNAKVTLSKDDTGITAIGIHNKREPMLMAPGMFLSPTGTAKTVDQLEPKLTPSVVVYPRGNHFRGFDVREFALVHDFIRDEVIPSFADFF
ncbi:hypothetical protein LCGC14_0741150 [marine sediment metagenome]|uniref:Uncharacterized protein n=1 Tax=marine sediment metagenome TaxID=412755 RepID=A0A0F9Q6R1_9ZZZZ